MLVAALSLGLPPPPNHTLAELQPSDALPHAPTSSYSSSLQPATDPSPRSREMLLAELVASLEGDNAQLRRSEERARAEAEAARAEQQREGAELREARTTLATQKAELEREYAERAEALSQKRASADERDALRKGLAALKVREEQVARREEQQQHDLERRDDDERHDLERRGGAARGGGGRAASSRRTAATVDDAPGRGAPLRHLERDGGARRMAATTQVFAEAEPAPRRAIEADPTTEWLM